MNAQDHARIAGAEAMHAQQLTQFNLLLDQWMEDDSKEVGQIAGATLMTIGALLSFVLDTIDPQAPQAQIGYDAVQETLDEAKQEMEFVKLAGYRLTAIVRDTPQE